MPEHALLSLPAPTGGAVRLYQADLRRPPEPLARLSRLLDPAERTRCAGLRDATARRRYTVAHALLRLRLATELDAPPETVRYHIGPHGRPELAGPEWPSRPELAVRPELGRRPLHFNLSHSADLALLACADVPVGVDIETVRPELAVARLAARYFPTAEAAAVHALPDHPAHLAYLRLWTRKEACAKAAGRRVFDGLRLPVGTVHADSWTLVHDPGLARRPDPPTCWLVRDLAGDNTHAAAVALLAARSLSAAALSAAALPGDGPFGTARCGDVYADVLVGGALVCSGLSGGVG